MRLDYEHSDRAARLFDAFRRREGWTDHEFSAHSGSIIPPSTLHRLLTGGSRFASGQVQVLANILAREVGCNTNHVIRYIETGDGAPRSLLELTQGVFIPFTKQGLDLLDAKLDACESHTLVRRIACTMPPSFLLTESVMHKLYPAIAASLPGNAEYNYRLLVGFGLGRQWRFMHGVGAQPGRTEVFFAEADFAALIGDTLPGVGCTTDEIDELLEFWIFDALYEREVYFGIFREPVRPVRRDFEMRPPVMLTVLDNRASLRHLAGKPSLQWVESQSSERESIPAVECDSALLASRRQAVRYDLNDKGAVEQKLKSLLSPTTWAYRSN